MIGEIARIGEAVVGGEESRLLEALIEDLAPIARRAKERPLLVRVELKRDPPTLELTPLELDPERAAEYAWVGNVRGNRWQTRATTPTLAYLLGQTPAKLAEEGLAPHDIKALLDRVFPDLFYVDADLTGSDLRYAYLLDAKRLGLVTEEEWQEILAQKPKARAPRLAEVLRARFDLPKDGVLYTLVVEGQEIAKLPSYRRFLVEDLVGEAFEKKSQGVCHLCGQKTAVTADFTRFKLLKFYINDKLSFAYGLAQDRWPQSYAVCRRCYTNLLAGERHLEKAFRTRVLQTETLLIPHLGNKPRSREALRALSEILTQAATGLDRMENVPRLLATLKAQTDLPQLTLLFVERSQSAVKVQEAIFEVEPSRIYALLLALSEANAWADAHFGRRLGEGNQPRNWIPGLSALLYLLPLRHQRGNPEVKPALTAFRQILLKEPLNRRTWIRGFLEILRFAHRKNPGLYATRSCTNANPCPEIHNLIPQMAAFLAFLEKAGVLEEVEAVQNQPKDFQSVFAELGLDEAKSALFLLGVLLARVASEQYKKGKTKPILEKVGFQGMPLTKVRRFAVELFEKLGEYRRLDASSEAIFGEALEGLTRREGDWPLSDEENAFYILLGYGFETRRILGAGQGGGDAE